MTDWTFYSPSARTASAGDLLRAIPSTRNLRLERCTVIDGEEVYEAIRAAEFLLGLDAILRLTNDSTASLRVAIWETRDRCREEYRRLKTSAGATDLRAETLRVTAKVTVPDDCTRAGHAEIADDLLVGLESVFPGGLALDPARGELVCAADILRASDSESRPYSHVDAQFILIGAHCEYVAHLLAALPPGLAPLLGRADGGLAVRGRVPITVSNAELEEARQLLNGCAAFASGGRVRFRREGVWEDGVDAIGANVAALPADWSARPSGVRGVLSRLFRR